MPDSLFQKRSARLSLLHWSAICLLVISLASGLSIHSSSRSRLPDWLSFVLPAGHMHEWHLGAGVLWVIVCMGYLLHLLGQQIQSRRRPDRQTLNWQWIRMGRWVVLITILTGLLTYVALPAIGASIGIQIHWYAAISLAAWVATHGVYQTIGTSWSRLKRFLGLKRPASSYLQWAIIVPVAAALSCWLVRDALTVFITPDLEALALPTEVVIEPDGRPDEPAWTSAKAVTVQTLSMVDVEDVVPVTIRAIRQSEVIHFLFSWPDATPSLKHLPLQKTSKGWVVLQNGLQRHDELEHYEDKFAVLLSETVDAAGGGAIALGAHGKHGAPGHGRGLHATSNTSVVDVWHWKSVRMHGSHQIDDNHFAAPYPEVPGSTRYTGGYKPDPFISGGYSDNWTWLRDGTVTPKRLPKDKSLMKDLQGTDLMRPLGMSWYETEPYDASRDDYPVGTVMPSVLWTTSFEGDRGDVRGQGQWRDGRWYLEITRGLKSNSKFDISIQDGIYLWVASFDHTQTRHSYHLRPVRLRLP